jgi:metal-sulfur cluster biosynthetic enzyme
MSESATVLKREITATRIPQGEALTLPKGTPVIITQALGGSFTVVVPSEAGLYRIDAEYADALGKEKPADGASGQPAEAGPVSEEQVWDVLKTCYDPEIPVNIVDLGLVYSLQIEQAAARRKGRRANDPDRARLRHGARHCPRSAAEDFQLSGVADADVQVVWDPPWSPDKISEEGKKKLGMVQDMIVEGAAVCGDFRHRCASICRQMAGGKRNAAWVALRGRGTRLRECAQRGMVKPAKAPYLGGFSSIGASS